MGIYREGRFFNYSNSTWWHRVYTSGKIEVENYDDGGSRRGYSDTDAENKGDAEMRADEGVDLVLGGTGVALGYTAAGEWLEYTVNVENDANDVSISASVSSGVETSSFCILVDGA